MQAMILIANSWVPSAWHQIVFILSWTHLTNNVYLTSLIGYVDSFTWNYGDNSGHIRVSISSHSTMEEFDMENCACVQKMNAILAINVENSRFWRDLSMCWQWDKILVTGYPTFPLTLMNWEKCVRALEMLKYVIFPLGELIREPQSCPSTGFLFTSGSCCVGFFAENRYAMFFYLV